MIDDMCRLLLGSICVISPTASVIISASSPNHMCVDRGLHVMLPICGPVVAPVALSYCRNSVLMSFGWCIETVFASCQNGTQDCKCMPHRKCCGPSPLL